MKPFDPRLLSLVPDCRAGIVGLFACGALQGAAAIGQAFAISALVVALVDGRDWHTAALWTVVAFVIRAVAAGAAESIAARTGTTVSTAVRHLLSERFLARGATGRTDGPRLLTLATQGSTSIEPYVARYLPTLANAVVLPPAAILAMLILDVPTGLIPVLTVPLLPLFAALIGATTAEATNRRWRTLTRLSGHFLDVMRGLPTLVSYGRAERQQETIRQVSHDHRRATVATLKLAFLSSAALELLATISVAIVAVWVGIQLAHGDMQLSLAMPLILLAPEAYWPIRRVGAEFHNAADGAAALEQVYAQIESTPTSESAAGGSPEPAGASASAPRGVRLTGVGYAYRADGDPVIVGLDAELPGPGLTVVTGLSGAGKTTLLELIAGLRAPDSGSVDAGPAHLVTQRPFLTDGTLRENLLWGTDHVDGQMLSDGHLRKVLADVGLASMVRTLPEGLNTRIGDDGFGLSAGQRARLALARAVLADPQLLLLDEPTAHLDAASEELVDELIVGLSTTRTVVTVTHRDGLLARADHHLVLGGAA
ncbi:ATP-binding cassette, subfamily C, CydD [Austwickia chelonae]|uniref:ABC transporter permease/ATP-binding protein CydD n=1 Tax=Austwickia chelonae NBRC 105200 TaxID=1184607 RepID=K6UN29_9MICO|nr:thiol reductant ABC exporter subunit CydD [Austwickia chelonae]GAB78636.1 ABC transporter permease/ATP-binding protein CydD [Austwickia chelonae NBRC 105200]SEW34278.1 ATP-binding cassette, subfamily C, CydD [Austwickia chelonae]